MNSTLRDTHRLELPDDTHCAWCGQPWPCDTALALRIVDAAREVARVYRAGVTGELTKALAALVAAVEETGGEA